MGDDMTDIAKLRRTIIDQRRALGAANAKVKALKDENKELRKQLADKEKPRT